MLVLVGVGAAWRQGIPGALGKRVSDAVAGWAAPVDPAVSKVEGAGVEVDLPSRSRPAGVEVAGAAKSAGPAAVAAAAEAPPAVRVSRPERPLADELAALEAELAAPDPDLDAIATEAQDLAARDPEPTRADRFRELARRAGNQRDERDWSEAREFSREFPSSFDARKGRYEAYLAAHREGGRYVRQALEGLEQVERDRDTAAYRRAFDHAQAYPLDVHAIAGLLAAYVKASPGGRFVEPARAYLAWHEAIQKPGDYRVTVLRGQVEATVGKRFSGGGPDLAVEIWVAGTRYGPTPAIPNSRDPNWNYTFPRPIRWKSGDSVVVRILDMDWSSEGTGVFRLTSAAGDPLALRLLTGEVRSAKLSRTRVVFSSDFAIPRLPPPG
jgi:hypothetical protein